jgi:acyl-[acyl-carrier-protein]-phospholipid O-acyltransferase/long-chain-fatty-acid--[acyl-carrier-protein] ligase
MKVYDGVGLIADKSGRDGGAGAARRAGGDAVLALSRAQVNRRWFPKVTVTVLEPVKLTVAEELKGRIAARPPARRCTRSCPTSCSARPRPTARYSMPWSRPPTCTA